MTAATILEADWAQAVAYASGSSRCAHLVQVSGCLVDRKHSGSICRGVAADISSPEELRRLKYLSTFVSA